MFSIILHSLLLITYGLVDSPLMYGGLTRTIYYTLHHDRMIQWPVGVTSWMLKILPVDMKHLDIATFCLALKQLFYINSTHITDWLLPGVLLSGQQILI